MISKAPNTWMRPTMGQSSKRRKKAEKTENFFEHIVDEELRTIDEKLGSLKKIYMSTSKFAHIGQDALMFK